LNKLQLKNKLQTVFAWTSDKYGGEINDFDSDSDVSVEIEEAKPRNSGKDDGGFGAVME
jgi:hypothetical protein